LNKINKNIFRQILSKSDKNPCFIWLCLDKFISIQELPGSLFNYKNNHHELLFSRNVVVSVTQHFSVIDVPDDMN